MRRITKDWRPPAVARRGGSRRPHGAHGIRAISSKRLLISSALRNNYLQKIRRVPTLEQNELQSKTGSHATQRSGKAILPTIRSSEFACGGCKSPDLDRAEAFLTESALRSRRADQKTAPHMRGHHPKGTHPRNRKLGEPRFLSLAFAVSDPGRILGGSHVAAPPVLESIDAPGGRARGGFRLKGPGRARGRRGWCTASEKAPACGGVFENYQNLSILKRRINVT